MGPLAPVRQPAVSLTRGDLTTRVARYVEVVMKHVELAKPDEPFDVVAGTKRSQAAQMRLESGDSEGGPDNRHPGSDQWLYVVAGEGKATVEGREITLAPGSLLLIEAGEAHAIANTGDEPLRTINVYAPPVY